MAATLKYLAFRRDRTGRIAYVFFQRHGRLYQLPPEWNPPSPEFLAEYNRLLIATQGRNSPERVGTTDGTMAALVESYLGSADFKEKKDRTRASYRRLCDMIRADIGPVYVTDIDRDKVYQLRDEAFDTPGEANNMLRMLKILFNFAVDRKRMIEASPAARIPELKLGTWRAWTDAECLQFETRWNQGTMQRRAYALALYTGQRRSDLVAMTRAKRVGGRILVKQQKTDVELEIPEHPLLTDELGRGVQGITHLLTTEVGGKPFDAIYFGAWFAEAIGAAKLPDACVLHGLRKTAARKLADVGCTAEEIMSITGHKTQKMVALYTEDADTRRRADRAIDKWTKG